MKEAALPERHEQAPFDAGTGFLLCRLGIDQSERGEVSGEDRADSEVASIAADRVTKIHQPAHRHVEDQKPCPGNMLEAVEKSMPPGCRQSFQNAPAKIDIGALAGEGVPLVRCRLADHRLLHPFRIEEHRQPWRRTVPGKVCYLSQLKPYSGVQRAWAEAEIMLDQALLDNDVERDV
jgi:hypothetical protein